MFCQECGKEVAEGLGFCPNCGAKIVNDDFGQSEPEQSYEGQGTQAGSNNQYDFSNLKNDVGGIYEKLNDVYNDVNRNTSAFDVNTVADEFIVDDDEEIIDTLGNGWVRNLLFHRRIRKSNMVLTNKRVYLQGRAVNQMNMLTRDRVEKLVNVEDITGSGFVNIGKSIVFAIITWVYFLSMGYIATYGHTLYNKLISKASFMDFADVLEGVAEHIMGQESADWRISGTVFIPWFLVNFIFFAGFVVMPLLKSNGYFKKMPESIWIICASVFNGLLWIRLLSELYESIVSRVTSWYSDELDTVTGGMASEIESSIQSAIDSYWVQVKYFRNITLLIGLIFILIYVFSGRVLYIIEYAGGKLGLRADWIGLEKVQKFNKVLNQVKDDRRQEVK